MRPKADIGVIGLSVMGQNLILNINDHGFSVIVYNRTVSKIEWFLDGPAKSRETIFGATNVEELVKHLKTPRKVLLMIKAGAPVDVLIKDLLPHLDPGDIIIDGSNSHFTDTIRRTRYLEQLKFLFVGIGISGGENGVRNAPSIMPGGSPQAWPYIEEIFKEISAKTQSGFPCCDWVGRDGAGHYVKMVHNGIQCADMQLISEVYKLMHDVLGINADQAGGIFDRWNDGELGSYLIQTTADILKLTNDDPEQLIHKISTSAGQKPCGIWAGENALILGVPFSLACEAVFSLSFSNFTEQCTDEQIIPGNFSGSYTKDRNIMIEQIRHALLASRIILYTQGFMQLHAAAREYGWDLDFAEIALIWSEGSLIRWRLLAQIQDAFIEKPMLKSLLMDNYFKSLIKTCLDSWRIVVTTAISSGIAAPALSSAISFYDLFKCKIKQ